MRCSALKLSWGWYSLSYTWRLQVKSSHLYLYSAFNNTNCVSEYQQLIWITFCYYYLPSKTIPSKAFNNTNLTIQIVSEYQQLIWITFGYYYIPSKAIPSKAFNNTNLTIQIVSEYQQLIWITFSYYYLPSKNQFCSCLLTCAIKSRKSH